MDAATLLAGWDRLFQEGWFPYSAYGYQDKFRPYVVRLTAYTAGERWLLVFEQVGYSYISLERPLHNWVLAMTPDTVDMPAWHARAAAETRQLTRSQPDYALSDEAARAAEERDGEEPKDPQGDWARLQEFTLQIDDEEVVVRPSFEDYRRAGCHVTAAQFRRNPTLELGDLYRVAAEKLAARFFSPDPLAEFALGAGHAFRRVVCDEGPQVIEHVLDETPPSKSDYCRRLAALLAGRRAKAASPPQGAADPVEKAVRKQLGVGPGAPLRRGDLAKVRELALGHDPKVERLDFCARLPNLLVLHIFGTNVADLGPLAGCAKLKELNAHWARVRDLGPLAGLGRLEKLCVSETAVRDLAPLAGLTRLRELELEATAVKDLEPLVHLVRLEELFLQSTKVVDLAPLAGMTRLGRLGVDHTRVADLAPLAGMKALQVLWCRDTKVTDLEPLGGLHALHYLALGKSPVRSLEPLVRCPALGEVSVTGSKRRPGVEKLRARGVRV